MQAATIAEKDLAAAALAKFLSIFFKLGSFDRDLKYG